MTAPSAISASPSPSLEASTADVKELPRMKAIYIVAIIVGFVFIVILSAAALGAYFSQSTIDKKGKDVFEQQKTKTADSVAKATRVVKKLPNLVNDAPYTDLPTKLFDRVSAELKVADIKQLNLIGDGAVLPVIKANCSQWENVITDKMKYLEMCNNATEVHNQQLKNLGKPIDEAKSNFENLTMVESKTRGRLSKSNIFAYSETLISMLKSYQTSIIAKYDYFIESFNNQIGLQDSVKFRLLIFIIVSILIAFVVYGIQVGTFVAFVKEKISPDTHTIISNILIGICGFLVAIYFIVALLGSVGLSPFAYQCELKDESQNSDAKFYNFNGEAANLRSITGGCEKGKTIYSKMSPYLDNARIGANLNSYQSDVTQFATILPTLEFVDNSSVIRRHMASLMEQRGGYLKYQKDTCLNSAARRAVVNIAGDIKNLHDSLQNLTNRLENILPLLADLSSKINPVIDESFAGFRNLTGIVVGNINAELKSTDFSCVVEKPLDMCIEYDLNWTKTTLANWIIFSEFVVLLIQAILFRIFAKKLTREVSAFEKLQKQYEKNLNAAKAKEDDEDKQELQVINADQNRIIQNNDVDIGQLQYENNIFRNKEEERRQREIRGRRNRQTPRATNNKAQDLLRI
ncbi:unnamed protein product [Caenorhabditis angaria]|uniref:Uncharacterized protein n=1 Tax=Caenorhabditis angaria TaxID=860376 RepID=A0A9P1I7K8_9PELO|nr:unnamed protein product [Caenorhabditis angaria]